MKPGSRDSSTSSRLETRSERTSITGGADRERDELIDRGDRWGVDRVIGGVNFYRVRGACQGLVRAESGDSRNLESVVIPGA
jgi:hypothetical protein